MFQKSPDGYRAILHLKRHVTDAEARVTGPVRDIRRTPEALDRMKAMAVVHNQPVQVLQRWEPWAT